MTRVQTKYNGDTLLFIRQDGRSVDHAPDFDYNGREYYFFWVGFTMTSNPV